MCGAECNVLRDDVTQLHHIACITASKVVPNRASMYQTATVHDCVLLLWKLQNHEFVDDRHRVAQVIQSCAVMISEANG